MLFSVKLQMVCVSGLGRRCVESGTTAGPCCRQVESTFGGASAHSVALHPGGGHTDGPRTACSPPAPDFIMLPSRTPSDDQGSGSAQRGSYWPHVTAECLKCG